MPYVNKPRPYKKEYEQQKARGELERRMERQRLRREYDKKHKDSSTDKDKTAESLAQCLMRHFAAYMDSSIHLPVIQVLI